MNAPDTFYVLCSRCSRTENRDMEVYPSTQGNRALVPLTSACLSNINKVSPSARFAFNSLHFGKGKEYCDRFVIGHWHVHTK